MSIDWPGGVYGNPLVELEPVSVASIATTPGAALRWSELASNNPTGSDPPEVCPEDMTTVLVEPPHPDRVQQTGDRGRGDPSRRQHGSDRAADTAAPIRRTPSLGAEHGHECTAVGVETRVSSALVCVHTARPENRLLCSGEAG